MSRYPEEYERSFPLVAKVGDETVEVEVRMAGKGVHFYGDVLRGTYADFVRWQQKNRATGPTDWDVLADLAKAGCPGRTISDLRKQVLPTRSLEAAKDFLAADRADVVFLSLLGPKGVGKSLAAGWVMREWGKAKGLQVQPGVNGYRWVQASALIGASQWGPDAQWVQQLERASLLVVDELGADQASRAAKSRITELLLARHARLRATVFTSNLSHQEFAEVYGEALVDRIRSSGIDPELGREKSLRRKWTH